MSKKLYTLCIGINNFDGAGTLYGCENDAEKMFNYLMQACKDAGFGFDGKLLKGKAAKKSDIINNFYTVFKAAQTEDIAVFYFSGHGAQEVADEVFHNESSSKKLNTLVCQDSRKNDVTDLADKELRYLMHEVTKDKTQPPHFVVITDCCHAGNITRSGEFVLRRTVENKKIRQWKDFVFADKISKEDINTPEQLNKQLPRIPHIHLGACTPSQKAYELNRAGIFTSGLLNVLDRTSGEISYNELHSRVKEFVQLRKEQQTPVFDVVEAGKDLLNQRFLGGITEAKSNEEQVEYDSNLKEWVLKVGALQGMPTDNIDKITVTIFQDSKTKITTSVKEVLIDVTTLNLTETSGLSQKKAYKAAVKGKYRQPVTFFLKSNNDQEAKQMKSLRHSILNHLTTEQLLDKSNIVLSDNQADSEYTVFIKNNAFYISRTKDIDQRPIAEQQLLNKFNAKTQTAKYIKAIASYHFVKNINNPKTALKGAKSGQPAAEIQVFKIHDENDRTQDEQLKPNEQQEIIIEAGTKIAIKTVNNMKLGKLHFALLKMDDLFGINTKLLGADVQEVFQQKTLAVDGFTAKTQQHQPYIKDFKFKATRHSYKLIASLYTFKINKLDQLPVQPPKLDPKPPKQTTPRKLTTRKPPQSASWMAYNIDIVIKNGDLVIGDS